MNWIHLPANGEKGKSHRILFHGAARGYHADVGITASGVDDAVGDVSRKGRLLLDNFRLVERCTFRETNFTGCSPITLTRRSTCIRTSPTSRRRLHPTKRERRKGRGGVFPCPAKLFLNLKFWVLPAISCSGIDTSNCFSAQIEIGHDEVLRRLWSVFSFP